jgi:hypothetical protein
MLRVLLHLLLHRYLVVPRVCAAFCAAPFRLESLPCLPRVFLVSCLDVEHAGGRDVVFGLATGDYRYVASLLPAVLNTLVACPGR